MARNRKDAIRNIQFSSMITAAKLLEPQTAAVTYFIWRPMVVAIVIGGEWNRNKQMGDCRLGRSKES
jgi:hypothetical protein